MTDNEIIKAFRCCYLKEDLCEECPCLKDEKCTDMGNVFNIPKQILDLINRQKAEIENYKQIAENQQSVSMDKEVEIKRLRKAYLKQQEIFAEQSLENERLKAEVERLQKYHDDMEDAIYSFREDHAKVKFFKKEIKAEAVKEFAERLQNSILPQLSCSTLEKKEAYYFCLDNIDKLLKEMGVEL